MTDHHHFSEKHRRLVWIVGISLTLVISAALVWACVFFWDAIVKYYQLFTREENRVQARQLVESWGQWGICFFIGIQVLQVVFAPIPGEATGFIGGFIFGFPWGFFYSTVGLTGGSVLAFLLGRWLEVKFVVKVVKPQTLKKFHFLIKRQGALVSFFLFLIPGFPKDYLCFILGLSPMPFRLFFIICAVGRIPGTIMLTLQGAHIYEGNYLVTLFLFALCFLVGGVMYYYRESLYRWMTRWNHEEAETPAPFDKQGR